MNRLKNIVLLLSFLVFQLGYGQQCSLRTLADDLVDASEDFKEILNSASGFDAYRVLSLAEEDKVVRVGKDALTDVSDYLVSSTKSIDDLVDEIKKAGGYTKWNEIKTLSKLESSIIDSFNRRTVQGVSESDVENIILNAQIIDETLGGNTFLHLIENLVKNDKFKNPEDILENLNSVFSGNNVNSISAKNLIKEFEEGKYWINQGEEVFVSKKWTTNANEVDVTIITKNALVECKNIIGGSSDAVRDNINNIISKFTTESKLSSSIKNQYPNHYGKISLSNTSNPYYNLDKTQFINKVKADLLDKAGGVNKNSLTNAISELHIETGQDRFIIKSTDW